MIAENTKIYQTIKDCDNIPDKEKEQALIYLKKIVEMPTFFKFCDEYDLRRCFAWSDADLLGYGDCLFWFKINDYLEGIKQK